MPSLQALYKFDQKRDFPLTEVLADGQFSLCKNELATLQVTLHCVSKDEHVSEVERLIQTTKERCQCSFHKTPFKKLLRGFTVGLLKNVMFYLNAFPQKDGESPDLFPYTIVQGKVVDYNLHWKLAFGSYAHHKWYTRVHDRGNSNGD